MDNVKTFEDDAINAGMNKPESKHISQEDKPKAQRAMDDQLWEERMASAMAELTKRLEEKFEEDKNAALLEQSRQVNIHFLCWTLKGFMQQWLALILRRFKVKILETNSFGS